jgi:hypothetical protein
MKPELALSNPRLPMRFACCLSWGKRSCDRTRVGSKDNVPLDPVFTITRLEHADLGSVFPASLSRTHLSCVLL